MSDAATLMDRIYGHQRHIYDATRKFYLLGRDELIAGLRPPDGARILEIGCGTGRNLIATARRYPQARCYGIDISQAMLATARANILRAGLDARIQLAAAGRHLFRSARALRCEGLRSGRVVLHAVDDPALARRSAQQCRIARAIGDAPRRRFRRSGRPAEGVPPLTRDMARLVSRHAAPCLAGRNRRDRTRSGPRVEQARARPSSIRRRGADRRRPVRVDGRFGRGACLVLGQLRPLASDVGL